MYTVKHHVDVLRSLLLQDFFANELAVVLSNFILVRGCGYPIFIIVVHSGTTSCAFIDDAQFSASPTDAMKVVMVFTHCK